MSISNLCYRVFKLNSQFSCTAFVLHVLMVVEEGVESLPSDMAIADLADTSNRNFGRFQLLPNMIVRHMRNPMTLELIFT